MAIYLGDINTRARGLGTRLLEPAELDRLAHARSLFGLRRELSALGVCHADTPATPEGLDRAIRRRAAKLMAILGRWSTEDRDPILAVVLEDEDRRSIQSILRGAEQGAGSEARMSGLLPTTTLSERALRVLASQPTMADVVRMLVLWNHPLGAPLVEAVSADRPSLFEVEVALQQAFAKRALEHARKGGSHLLEYARQVVDVMNIWSVLLHFPERDETIAELSFIEGGQTVDRELFDQLFRSETFADAHRRLARELRESALANAFEGEPRGVASLDAAMLRTQIEHQNRAARVTPESAAPLISFALRLRAEVLNLRRVVWGVALRAPAALIQTEMVAP
ncbi:MAG: V-type ATPase subunit [Myxococcales bacterium]|nr:MAG: V-type ATPase subunit [Myxococcales bacterium]